MLALYLLFMNAMTELSEPPVLALDFSSGTLFPFCFAFHAGFGAEGRQHVTEPEKVDRHLPQFVQHL